MHILTYYEGKLKSLCKDKQHMTINVIKLINKWHSSEFFKLYWNDAVWTWCFKYVTFPDCDWFAEDTFVRMVL